MQNKRTRVSSNRRRSYDVAIYGECFGMLAWRGYRLLWTTPDGEHTLFDRNTSISKARDFIAKSAGVTRDKVIFTNVTNTKG